MASDSFKEFLKNLGSVIRQTRKEKGLTQGELGSQLGKPQSTIARLESAGVNDTHIGSTKAQEPASADDIAGRWEKIAYALKSLNEKDKTLVVELVERVFQLMK